MFNTFDCEIIRNLAATEPLNLVIKTATDSTNDDAKSLAMQGEKEITVVLAGSQSKGRGRKGRSFFSPENTGCYMSILLRPRCAGEVCTYLTPLAAAATAVAIERLTGRKADIKWINDIYIDGKKVAGILTEGAFTGDKVSYAVVGIGINVAQPSDGFPQAIAETAGALDSRDADIKSKLVGEILRYFITEYQRLEEKLFFDEYERRLLYIGEQIEVSLLGAERTFTAKVLGIDKDFHLLAETEGKTLTLDSAEISTNKFGMRN